MAEPNPKRTKMDNSNVQSSSTSPKDPKNQPQLIDTETHFFQDIIKMPGFVDHTHFIKLFVQHKKRLAIFAPRRFGKSSHLDMVQQFFEIDIDKRTGEIASSVNGPAKNRKNYELFKETHIITDGNKELVEDHLGKHPVIHIDLKKAEISSVQAAEMHCRNAVQDAYREHSYLETSTKLEPGRKKANAEEQKRFENWCNDDMCKQEDLSKSLKNLTRYLYNHCNSTKVYVLVDEFDAINTSAMRKIGTKHSKEIRVEILQDICGVLKLLFGDLVKGKFALTHVAGVLFTGVSYVSGLGMSEEFNSCTMLRFLDDTNISGDSGAPDFVPFYGATREEVEKLIQNLVKKNQLLNFTGKEEFLNVDTKELDAKKILNEVESRYNGYYDKKGHRIFCLWSVLQYLEKGDPINYWNQTGGIRYLHYILNNETVAWEIIKLMRGDVIEFNRLNELGAHKLVQLHDLFSMGNEGKVGSGVVFNFLMDQGYLTYPEGGAELGECKLPNEEVRAALFEIIHVFVKQHWKMDTKSCRILIDDITSSLMKNENEKALQMKVSAIYKEISLCLRPLEKVKSTFLNEAIISCVIHNLFSGMKQFRLGVDLPIKDAKGKCITSGRPDFLMVHKNEACTILWELKYNKDRKDEYTSLHALQEARGIAKTIHDTYKNYLPSLESIGKKLEEILVIGLSVDSDIKLSLSYAVGMEQKIFSMSETESTDFPSLYQTYHPVSLPCDKK